MTEQKGQISLYNIREQKTNQVSYSAATLGNLDAKPSLRTSWRSIVHAAHGKMGWQADHLVGVIAVYEQGVSKQEIGTIYFARAADDVLLPRAAKQLLKNLLAVQGKDVLSRRVQKFTQPLAEALKAKGLKAILIREDAYNNPVVVRAICSSRDIIVRKPGSGSTPENYEGLFPERIKRRPRVVKSSAKTSAPAPAPAAGPTG